MDSRALLDRLLTSGQSVLKDSGLTSSEGRISDLGKGAVAGGLLGLLLGSKSGRKLATYGGIAALAMVAYRRYSAESESALTSSPAADPVDARNDGRVILRALLAAARADGHIDARERALIDQEIVRMGGDSALRHWVATELNGPLDPQAVAAGAAGNPVLASEIYLASALAIAEIGFLERAYLDELGRHLGLDTNLRQRLEHQALVTSNA